MRFPQTGIIFFHCWCSHHRVAAVGVAHGFEAIASRLKLMESFGLSLFCVMSFQ